MLPDSLFVAERRALITTLEEVRHINGREEAVVVTDDGNTIVCWHPQPDIPYEMTRVSVGSEGCSEFSLDNMLVCSVSSLSLQSFFLSHDGECN